ncbi:hypothetical protein CSKR_110701 [Clonorchis sinensis]|uniref:Uncharacterized protein n=1 Tax=Clonorchis sinensis TaxID=79923 RepID=A0A3R7JX89_CLOSI|nr:hypothetical protein CSKR_110701 [Clonorchis sinensis]
MSHAIHSAFSVSEWDNAPCTLSHGLVNPSQTEARSSGLPYPPRSRLESSNSYSTLPFSALNLIERDKTGQEIIGQHLDTTALRIPASTSNQTCILSTTDDTNCETSPDSNSESSMTEHHGRLNASHSPQDAFSRSDSKRHLEVPSYFDTIFQHLLEVYNQVKSAKASEPSVINPVSLFLYDGFSRDTQKSPTSVDNKPQCKLPSLFPGNLSMDPLRPTNVWFGSNGTNSGAHHRNSVSSSSSQTTPKGPSQSETQVENDAIQTPSMKTGNDFEPNSFGQPENGLTPTPESDNTSLQTISIPKLSQGANYFYYGLQLMAKSFMSRYLQSNPNEIEKTPMTKAWMSPRSMLEDYGFTGLTRGNSDTCRHSKYDARIERLNDRGAGTRALDTATETRTTGTSHVSMNIFRISLVIDLKHPSDTGIVADTVNFDQVPSVCCSPTINFKSPTSTFLLTVVHLCRTCILLTSGAKSCRSSPNSASAAEHIDVVHLGLHQQGRMIRVTSGVRMSVLSGSSSPGTCGRSFSIRSTSVKYVVNNSSVSACSRETAFRTRRFDQFILSQENVNWNNVHTVAQSRTKNEREFMEA